MSALADLIVRVVEPGTWIENDDGARLQVDDGHCVRRGRDLFLTQPAFDALKAAVPEVAK